MEDNISSTELKRKLADQELSDILGNGFVNITPEQRASDFVNLPLLEPATDTQSSTTVNNLNVNVNINDKNTHTNTTQREVQSIVQNAIPNLSTDAIDLKKNLPEILNTDSLENLNKVHMNLQNDEQVYNVSFTGGMSSYISNPDIIVDIPEPNEISSYSHSAIDGDTITNKNTYQALNNIVSYSMSDQNILNLTPYSSIDSSIQNYRSDTNNEFNIKNLEVQPEYDNSMEQVSTLFNDKRQMEMQEHFNEKNKKLQQEALFDRQQSSENDLYDANTVGVNMGIRPPKSMDSAIKPFTHINATPSTIPMFVSKMNSPPIWRTVLG